MQSSVSPTIDEKHRIDYKKIESALNAIQGLLFDSEKIGEVINSESYGYADRLGKNCRTLDESNKILTG